MPAPWEKYASESGPWQKYTPPVTQPRPEDQPESPGFFRRLGQSMGIPTSREEAEEAKKQVKETAILGPGGSFLKNYVTNLYQTGKESFREAQEAGANIAEGGPVGANLGKAGAAAMNLGLQAIPIIGPTVETAGEDIAKGNIAGGAGGITGAALQVAAPKLPEVSKLATAKISHGLSRIDQGLEARRVRLGTKEITKAARPIATNLEFAADLQTALPDVAKAARESGFETSGGTRVREFVDNLDRRQDAIWQQNHEPMINQHPMAMVNNGAIQDAANAAINEGMRRADPRGTARAEAWIDEQLSQPLDLKTADLMRRELNRMTKSEFHKLSVPEVEAKKAALSETINQIENTLVDLGEPGIRETNRRWGALGNVADSLRRRIAIAEREPGRLEKLGRAFHGYIFGPILEGRIPTLGVALRGRDVIGAIRGTTIADTLERGATRLGKTSLEPPGPYVPTQPRIAGLLPAGPIITEAPADTSFVRGVPATYPNATQPTPNIPVSPNIPPAGPAPELPPNVPEQAPVPSPYEATRGAVAEAGKMNRAISLLSGGKRALTDAEIEWIGKKSGLDMSDPANVPSALAELKRQRQEARGGSQAKPAKPAAPVVPEKVWGGQEAPKVETPPVAESVTKGKEPWEMTKQDLVAVPERRFPKGAFRGELHDATGDHVANLYVENGRAYVGEPKPYGSGEVVRMFPGSFGLRDFENAGGLQVSGSQRVRFWKFRKPEPEQVSTQTLPQEAESGTVKPNEETSGTPPAQQVGPGPSAEIQRPPESVPPAIQGAETTISVPGEDISYPAKYAVYELEDVKASHSGVTFLKNERYSLKNEREYTNAVNTGKVISWSSPGKFEPRYHITDNPDATNGPIVVDDAGQALGGNGRAMILDRVYRYNPTGAEQYKNMLAENGQRFGIDPNTVKGMKKPVLVRIIDRGELEARGGPQPAINVFNKVGTAALTPSERAIADSRKVSIATLDDIGVRLAGIGEDATLASILEGESGKDVLANLASDGVIGPQEWSGLSGKAGLTAAGKERISNLLIGKFFDDASQMEATPAGLRGKLERIAAPIAKAARIPGWDILPVVREAVDVLTKMREFNYENFGDLKRQANIFGRPSNFSQKALALAEIIDRKGPRAVTDMFRRYAQDAVDSGEPPLMGERVEDNPTKSYQQAFGGNQ